MLFAHLCLYGERPFVYTSGSLSISVRRISVFIKWHIRQFSHLTFIVNSFTFFSIRSLSSSYYYFFVNYLLYLFSILLSFVNWVMRKKLGEIDTKKSCYYTSIYDVMCDDHPEWHPKDIKMPLIALPLCIKKMFFFLFLDKNFSSIIFILL